MEFKKSNLSVYKAGNSDYPFLDDELVELLNEKIGKNDLKMFYSLGHSQGDGLRFEGQIDYKLAAKLTNIVISQATQNEVFEKIGEMTFNVKGTTHHYYHKNTMDVDFDYYEISEKAGAEIEKFCAALLESLKELSKELEKAGYEIIEAEDKDNLFRSIFRNFLSINNIESDIDLFDLEYSETEKEGYTNIYTGSDSVLYKGLWVKLPEIKKSSRVVEFYEFI